MDLTPARRTMSRTRGGLVLLGAAAVLIGGYLVFVGRPGTTPADHSAVPSSSATAQAAALTVRGTVVPLREAKLASAVSGAVTEILAPAGAAVEAGQPLLRVDGTSQAQAVKLAQADVSRARAELNAAKARRAALTASSTRGARNVASAEIVVADAALRKQVAALVAAQAEAALIELKAPFAGTVTAVDVEIGEQIGPVDAVVTLADTSAWLVDAFVPEASALRLTSGDPATLSFVSIPSLDLPGTVRRIAMVPTVRGTDVGYDVLIDVSGSDPRLRSGLGADVAFEGSN